jgi:hypothetical protein
LPQSWIWTQQIQAAAVVAQPPFGVLTALPPVGARQNQDWFFVNTMRFGVYIITDDEPGE